MLRSPEEFKLSFTLLLWSTMLNVFVLNVMSLIGGAAPPEFSDLIVIPVIIPLASASKVFCAKAYVSSSVTLQSLTSTQPPDS